MLNFWDMPFVAIACRVRLQLQPFSPTGFNLSAMHRLNHICSDMRIATQA